MCGFCKLIGSTTVTGNALVDGLLFGSSWQGTITYAFPQQTSDYAYTEETSKRFAAAAEKQVTATLFALEQSSGTAADDGFSVEGFTNADLQLGDASSANIRVAQSNLPRSSYAYVPSPDQQAGDVWLGRIYNYTDAKAGNYAWHTILHELGHSLGLKHGHEAFGQFPALPESDDGLEYSIMTYRSYVGGKANSYSYDTWDAPQTYMMADVAALQHLYGADFTTNSDDTVYSWTPETGDTMVNGQRGIDAGGKTIFATIWDGGGTDTYDLSAYETDLHIDLRPGESSDFGKQQLAHLGRNQWASGSIYNALQYEGDIRSLIENAIGGKGNDEIIGNLTNNMLKGVKGDDHLFGNEGDDHLRGGRGGDQLEGGTGNDWLVGGRGADEFIFAAGDGADRIADFKAGTDHLTFVGMDQSVVQSAIDSATQVGSDVVLSFDSGLSVTLSGFSLSDMKHVDFETLV